MNIFLKNWLLIVMLFSCSFLSAQTGIGTTTPNASAKLDVYSTNKGFLPPRVTLTSATDATTIASPAEGLLVYNLGSVGLQAGYYYWNGANWATIATASSAGNGVAASNMVSLYGKAYSTAIGDIANTNGYTFTVPVSGKYLFDFSSSGYMNQATMAITFKVRQGTTDLGTDVFSNANNNVHVVFTGKVEVNLQAGVTYNVYVTSTGSRDAGDYDRVYYKLVAGNLPVTGQTVEYGLAKFTGSDGGSLSNGALISFDATAAGNLVWSGNKFTLKANKTYELESSLAIYLSSSSVGGRFQIYDYTNSTALASGLFMSQNGTGTYNPSANSPMKAVVTPATDIQVGIRMLDYYGPAGPGIIGSTSYIGTAAAPNASYFMVKQIGSSAIVNPWTLSGTNSYNTTGNVGIGTNNPTSLLNIAGGGMKLASGFGNSINRPSLNTSIIGNYEIRGVGSISGNAQNDLADDGFLRLSAGGGTSVSSQSSIDISGFSTVTDMSNNIVMRTNGTERLRIDNSGNVNVTGKINVTDASGNLVTKTSGIINTGSFVQLDNVKVGPTRNGAGGSMAGLSIGAVSTSFVADISATYSNSNIGGSTATSVTYSTAAANSAFGWGFGQGNQSTYILNDTTNSRVYRIILMIGASYNNNFISIERLY